MNCKKDGIRTTTSPETCRRTTSRNLNVQLHSYSYYPGQRNTSYLLG